jgi:uncharacterized protein YecE (DUF72 family)
MVTKLHGSNAVLEGRSSHPAPRIGCSGWNYKAWRGHFYPQDLPASAWLARYASVFDTVELNNTFYRLPAASTFTGWREQTRPEFLMAVKASRYLTHLKRLREPVEPIARLFERAAELRDKLGPVLYQLPGNFPRDLARLETFLEALPRRVEAEPPPAGERRRLVQHVMEFRHPSWYVSDTFALLEEHRVALCLHDKLGSTITEPVIGPFLYVRFHGTSGHYYGSYDSRALDRWAALLAEHASDGWPVYAYFNNDPDAVATENARTLRAQVERRLMRAAAGTFSASPVLAHRLQHLQQATEATMAKYGKSAAKNVESAMKRRKKGTLKSGSGQTVRSRKQAIAIGLSEAREKGGKVPARKSSKTSRTRKTASGSRKKR